MFRVVLLFAFIVAASGFLHATRLARVGSSLYAKCETKYIDAKGRCPGDAGYVPLVKEAPTDFAAFQAAMKAKKAGGAAPAVAKAGTGRPSPVAVKAAPVVVKAAAAVGAKTSYAVSTPYWKTTTTKSAPAAVAKVAVVAKSSPVAVKVPLGSNGKPRCEEKYVDAKGRCPGDAGYVPLVKEAPTDFAAFQAAQKAKKLAGRR